MSNSDQTGVGTIHGTFERWARGTPSAVAARCGKEAATYEELNRRADRIADALFRAGVRRGDFVALTLERDIGLVAAILGILKAGAAYVPIDPGLPEQRQAFIRADARPAATLTATKYQGQCGQAAPVLCIDTLEDGGATEQASERVRVSANDLAYMIYTSGSTGEPKGVLVEHAHVLRLFSATESLFEFSADDVWTLFHSYAFDFSVWEIWGALFYGGTLVVIPTGLARSPADFAAQLMESGVTVLNQTPTAFSNLMPELLARGSAGKLRQIIFGGEALDPRRLAPWFARFGEQRPALVNMYGITETTVHVTYKRLLAQDATDAVNDIGAPLPDLKLYLLNERLRRVPVGVIGELYVGGAGVSRGYWNRPELTAQRFVVSPFDATEILYKTGDLARRTDSGALEYVGRGDDQVKLRGFRVELGEIERALQSHASVRDAVVALKGVGEERRIVAYLVLRDERAERWRALLLKHLRAVLPDHMVPSHVVTLQALPLTENGKVAREALPPPGSEDVWKEEYVAPRSAAESALCALFSRVLGVERVGIEDNFFALGGDSLRTVNLVAAAKEAGFEIAIDNIFLHPCVGDLATVVTPGSGAAHEPGRGPGPFELISEADRQRLPDDIESAYPMSYLQQGMIYHNLSTAENLFYHNVLNQRYRGAMDFERMRVVLADLMACHEVLRTSFHLTGYSEPLQLVQRNVPVPLHVKDIRNLSETAQAALLEREVTRLRRERYVLTAAPLFEANIYITAEDEFEFIWREHHALLDGWSLASLMSQVLTSYAQPAVTTNTPVATGYFRELIAAERAAVASPAEARFWTQYLDGACYTQLQAGSRASEVGVPQVRTAEMSPAQLVACKELAARLGVPLKSVFLAAYIRTVSKLSNELDVLVGMTTHGRPDDRPSTDLLGLYIATQPLRINCADLTWRELIEGCWRTEMDIWPHRFYPLAEIKRLRSGAELFETTFTYNHFTISEQGPDPGVTALRERTAFELDEAGIGVGILASGLDANSPREMRCQLGVSYNPEQFDAAFATKVLRYLEAALAAILADVDAVADVMTSTDSALVRALDREPREPPAGQTLVSELARLVRQYPDSTAGEFGNDRISYTQLDERSSLLAARLGAQGVVPGAIVGIDWAPGQEMLIGMLAVWKCGGAFLVLDSIQQPAQRLQVILAEAGVRDVLCVGSDRLAYIPDGIRVSRIDSLLKGSLDSHARRSLVGIEPSAASFAYVVYTSGSTGTPNGIAVTHANLLSYVQATQRRYEVGAGERVVQFANTGFDVFIEELAASVLSGGTLVMAERTELLDPDKFWRFVDKRKITFGALPTSFWNVLCLEIGRLRKGWRPARLRNLVLGGEAMQLERAREWLGHFGRDIAVWNSYGPAETTCIATVFDVRRLADPEANYARVPIGAPLENARCHVLGKDRRPVPSGVVGELHIGGHGVAWGYLNRPERTAERFLEWPVPGSDERRHYRTGDLVRVREDGDLEFVARVDGQLKIRGFRVETEEVMEAIRVDCAVRQCIVVPRQIGPERPGERHLVAYVVLQPGEEQGHLARIAAGVRQRLPEYMCPGAWVLLDHLPANANGKVDVAALPAPRAESPEVQGPEPDTLTQSRLRALWQEVLGRQDVAVDADFFALGGHSLLLTRLLLKISDTFAVDLSIAELMRKRTLGEMASWIDAVRQADTARAAETQDEREW